MSRYDCLIVTSATPAISPISVEGAETSSTVGSFTVCNMLQLHNNNWEEFSAAEKYSVKIKYDKILFVFGASQEEFSLKSITSGARGLHCPAQGHFNRLEGLTGDTYRLDPFPFYEAEPQECKHI